VETINLIAGSRELQGLKPLFLGWLMSPLKGRPTKMFEIKVFARECDRACVVGCF
jgi:hypothetical protein